VFSGGNAAVSIGKLMKTAFLELYLHLFHRVIMKEKVTLLP
jgi:hypothetical protein